MAVRMDCGIEEVLCVPIPGVPGGATDGVGTSEVEGMKVGSALVGAGGREGGGGVRIVKSSKQHISFPIHYVTSDCGQNKCSFHTLE